MVERRRIVQQWKRNQSTALVTLVRAEGSSYRRPGAHLLVAADGEYAGAISGGCLEAEVVRKAAWMVRDGAIVQRYSTLFDDTAEIPYGLGCGGVVDLLIEPARTPECEALLSAMEASLSGTPHVVATWLPGEGRQLMRAVWDAEDRLLFHSTALASTQLETHPPAYFCGQSGVYTDRLSAPLRLFLLGAGHDSAPVVEFASLLGWRVFVVDGRPNIANPERFPQAETICTPATLNECALSSADAVVIMTHSYEQDRSLLTEIMRRSAVPGYIGLLGAAHRSSLLVSEVAAALDCSVASCCERLWAPVGLDLGGDGAEAIALAVIAEVQAWSQGRLAASRRLTAERVQQHVAAGGASRYLQAHCATQ